MQDNRNQKTEKTIKQKALKILSKAIGVIEPYNEEGISEMIFRLQLLLPEAMIQKIYMKNHFLLTFFYAQQQLFITIDDLALMALRSKKENHVLETRKEFSKQIHERKAALIRCGIQSGIIFLNPKKYDTSKFEILLLTEFLCFDNHWVYSIEVFSSKIANKVKSCLME